jgi:hypothetical protein
MTLIDIGYIASLVLIGVITWREARRADRLDSQLQALTTTIETSYVPRERYEESAEARRLLEDSLREGFLPALQGAVVANTDSLALIRRFQDEHVRVNQAREGIS